MAATNYKNMSNQELFNLANAKLDGYAPSKTYTELTFQKRYRLWKSEVKDVKVYVPDGQAKTEQTTPRLVLTFSLDKVSSKDLYCLFLPKNCAQKAKAEPMLELLARGVPIYFFIYKIYENDKKLKWPGIEYTPEPIGPVEVREAEEAKAAEAAKKKKAEADEAKKKKAEAIEAAAVQRELDEAGSDEDDGTEVDGDEIYGEDDVEESEDEKAKGPPPMKLQAVVKKLVQKAKKKGCKSKKRDVPMVVDTPANGVEAIDVDVVGV